MFWLYGGRKVRCWTIGSRRAATAAVADRSGDALAATRRESIWRSVGQSIGRSVAQLSPELPINVLEERDLP